MKIDVKFDRQLIADAIFEILENGNIEQIKDSTGNKCEDGFENHTDHEAIWSIDVIINAIQAGIDFV